MWSFLVASVADIFAADDVMYMYRSYTVLQNTAPFLFSITLKIQSIF